MTRWRVVHVDERRADRGEKGGETKVVDVG